MKVKQFVFPSFEEWVKKGNEVRVELGAYCCEVSPSAWRSDSTIYMLAASLVDRNPLNIYTPTMFSRSFEDKGDNEELKTWYYTVTLEFNTFWQEHVKSTYLEE